LQRGIGAKIQMHATTTLPQSRVNTMQAFRWDRCFLTGLPTVDEQQHHLVDIINRFGAALMRPQGANGSAASA